MELNQQTQSIFLSLFVVVQLPKETEKQNHWPPSWISVIKV